jgi:hypothetical protein
VVRAYFSGAKKHEAIEGLGWVKEVEIELPKEKGRYFIDPNQSLQERYKL